MDLRCLVVQCYPSPPQQTLAYCKHGYFRFGSQLFVNGPIRECNQSEMGDV